MELHQLRYFTAAAEGLSISRAAERLHLSQPALSRQIAALEAELGVTLFARVKKRIVLTDAGLFFLPKARQMICDLETAAQQVKERFGGATRTLRLGFLSIFLDDLVAPAMKEFRRKYPKVKVSLFELSPRAQLERLRGRELDAAILGNLEEVDRERFSVSRLSRHRMAAVLAEDHPLAKRKSVKLSALARDPWVSLCDAAFPGRREFLRGICASAGFEPQITSEVDSLSLLLGVVAAGEGVALLPEHAQKLSHTGCVFMKIAPPTPMAELVLVQPKVSAGIEMEVLAGLITQRAADTIE